MQIATARTPRGPVTTEAAASVIEKILGPRPAVSVYRSGGERSEISGAVLANWAFKTAGLLTDEVEACAGEKLDIRCGWGWRPLALALGAWAAGLELVTDPSEEGPRHLASDSPDDLRAHAASATAFESTLAVPVTDLASSWADDAGSAGQAHSLSAGVLDYGSLVRGFGDRFEPYEPVTGTELSLPQDWAYTPDGGADSAVLVDLRGGGAGTCGTGIPPRIAPRMLPADIIGCAALLSGGRRIVVVLDPDADLEEIRRAEGLR